MSCNCLIFTSCLSYSNWPLLWRMSFSITILNLFKCTNINWHLDWKWPKQVLFIVLWLAFIFHFSFGNNSGRLSYLLCSFRLQFVIRFSSWCTSNRLFINLKLWVCKINYRMRWSSIDFDSLFFYIFSTFSISISYSITFTLSILLSILFFSNSFSASHSVINLLLNDFLFLICMWWNYFSSFINSWPS